MYTHINDVEHTHTPHAFVVVNMAIDLTTNRDSLLEAYKDVADDKTNTNWLVQMEERTFLFPSFSTFFIIDRFTPLLICNAYVWVSVRVLDVHALKIG